MKLYKVFKVTGIAYPIIQITDSENGISFVNFECPFVSVERIE